MRLYSIYLSNITRGIDSYVLTKNLNSSSVSTSDLMCVAMDLDEIVYLSNIRELNGECSLFKSNSFLTDKLPIDSKGIILSDIGVDIVSKEVLKYCGSLLESGKVINTSDLGKLFIDIAEGLTSNDALSEQLLKDVYKVVVEEDEEYTDDDNGLDFDDYAKTDLSFSFNSSYKNINSDKKLKYDITDELEYNDYTDEKSKRKGTTGVSGDSFKKEPEYDYTARGKCLDADKYEGSIDTDVVEAEISLSYNSNKTVNDKLANAISVVGSRIVKTPDKLKKSSTTVYTHMVEFDDD